MTDRVEEIRGRAEKYYQLFKDEDVDVSMRIGDIRYLLDEVDRLRLEVGKMRDAVDMTRAVR